MKIPIIIGALLIIAIIVVGSLGTILSKIEWTDKNGFTHNVKESTSFEQDENVSRSYAIVTILTKEMYESMTDHEFIERVTPILEAYAGKQYTTFDLGDGTGIYFPGSDIKEDAMYGPIDENGKITSVETFINISGTNVEKETTAPVFQEESKSAIEALPEEYKNDSSVAVTIDGTTYVNLFVDIGQMDNAVNAVAQAYVDFGTVYLRLENEMETQGYVVANGTAERNDDVIATVAEKIQ